MVGDPHCELERRHYNTVYTHARSERERLLRATFLSASERAFDTILTRVATGRVLEVGCGTGEICLRLVSAGAQEVIGVDISPHAIEAARERARSTGIEKQTQFVECNFECSGFEPGSFDVVIDRETLSSLDPESAIRQIASLLRPGGVFLAMECLDHNPIFRLNRIVGRWRGTRTEWACRHILTEHHIDLMRQIFSEVNVQHFHLFTVLLAPLGTRLPSRWMRPLATIAGHLDAILLSTPLLSKLAFKVVIEARH